jgi:hypothetical protein
MTRPHASPPPRAVPLPLLSDEAAVEIYLFVESLFLLVESHYGDQIQRHFESISRHHLFDPDLDQPLDDPPF